MDRDELNCFLYYYDKKSIENKIKSNLARRGPISRFVRSDDILESDILSGTRSVLRVVDERDPDQIRNQYEIGRGEVEVEEEVEEEEEEEGGGGNRMMRVRREKNQRSWYNDSEGRTEKQKNDIMKWRVHHFHNIQFDNKIERKSERESKIISSASATRSNSNFKSLMTSSPELNAATSRNVLSSFQSFSLNLSDSHRTPLSHHRPSQSSSHPLPSHSPSHPPSHSSSHPPHHPPSLTHTPISSPNLNLQPSLTLSGNKCNESTLQNRNHTPFLSSSSKLSYNEIRNLRSRVCVYKDLEDIRKKKEIEKKKNKLSNLQYELLSRAYCYKEQTFCRNRNNHSKINNEIHKEKEDKSASRNENNIFYSIPNTSKINREKKNYIHDLPNISDRNKRRSGTPGSLLNCMQSLGIVIWDHPGVRPTRFEIQVYHRSV